MATNKTENLEERLERIRRKNEEIEKKYREAEEDRLKALQNNAMVEVKPPKDEDWPKAHKYDKIDFTYDVKPEKLEEHNNNNKKLLEATLHKSKREYKKFVDGEGPPPDPAYNFLADAERDNVPFSKQDNSNKNMENRKEQNRGNKNSINRNGNNNSNNSNNNSNSNNESPFNKQRGNSNNKSFRGGYGNGRQQQQQQKFPKFQKQKSMPEYEQWRTEREKIDEARINRQKIGDGKWKREWDNDKMNSENEALLKPERVTIGDVIANAGGLVKKGMNPHGRNHNNHHGGHTHHLQQQQQQQQQQNIGGHNSVHQNYHNLQQQPSYHQQNADCLIEKRGNITVSVSQTGEVKSVKLTSAPAIGTGRVGPRQLNKPQFSIQTVEKNTFNSNPPMHANKNINTGQVVGHGHLNSPKSQQHHHQQQQNAHSPKMNANQDQGMNHRPQFHQNSNNAITSPTGGALVNIQSDNTNPSKSKKKHPQQQSQQKVHARVDAVPLNEASISANVISKIVPNIPVTDAAIENELIIQTALTPAGILPVDLSHKPEFAKKSVQERLLRVRQSQSSASSPNAENESKGDCKIPESETKNVTPSETDSKTDIPDTTTYGTEVPKSNLNVVSNEANNEIIETQFQVSAKSAETPKDLLEIDITKTLSSNSLIEVEVNSNISDSVENSSIKTPIDTVVTEYENIKNDDKFESTNDTANNIIKENIVEESARPIPEEVKPSDKSDEQENTVPSTILPNDEMNSNISTLATSTTEKPITEECKTSPNAEEITNVIKENSDLPSNKENVNKTEITSESEKCEDLKEKGENNLQEELNKSLENEIKEISENGNQKENVPETATSNAQESSKKAEDKEKENPDNDESNNNSNETNN